MMIIWSWYGQSSKCSTCGEGKDKGKRRKGHDEKELPQMSESLQAGKWQVLRMFRISKPHTTITANSLRDRGETWRLVQRG